MPWYQQTLQAIPVLSHQLPASEQCEHVLPTKAKQLPWACTHTAELQPHGTLLLLWMLLLLTLVVRGSHLKAASRTQPVAFSTAICSCVRGSICRRRFGNQHGSLRHMLLLLIGLPTPTKLVFEETAAQGRDTNCCSSGCYLTAAGVDLGEVRLLHRDAASAD
jgi:hypothetical protein